MPVLHIHKLHLPTRRHRCNSCWWRRWCFVKVVLWRFRMLAMVMAITLIGGALAFMLCEPSKHHSFTRALFFVWSLLFGEPPEAFPRHIVLQTMFFTVPLVGLVVVLQGILEFANVIRDRRRSERSWCLAMANSFSDHIILVGLGRLGIQTFRLLRKLGEAVVVIERSPDNPFLEDVRRDGSPLFICDARREAILKDARVDQARSILLCTTDDMANLEIALDARRINPRVRAVLRMFDPQVAERIRDGLNIRYAISQSALSAPTFAMMATDGTVLNTQVVGNEFIVTQQWHVTPNGPLCDKSVGQVLSEYGFSVIEQRRPDGVAKLFPPPTTRLTANDQLVVQGAYARLLAVRA